MGLAKFASDIEIESTDQLLQMVKEYFKPPKRDLRGFASINEVTNMEGVETFSDDDDGDEVNANVNVPEVPHGVLVSRQKPFLNSNSCFSVRRLMKLGCRH